jgi:hypothetical protein
MTVCVPLVNERKKVPSVDGAITPMLEHLCARTSAQHVGVVDVAGPGHHGMDQGQDLPSRSEPADASAQLDRGVTEPLEPETLGHGGNEHQAGIGHQVGLVEGHRDAVDSARYWLDRSASFVGENYGVKYRNSPSIGGIFRGCARVRSHGYAVNRG